MGLYDGIKDVAKIVQQADNLELYRQLLDLSAQALDLQAEVARLTEENKELKKSKDIENDIVYHIDPFITRKSDAEPIKYCAVCWTSHKLVPIQLIENGRYKCLSCKEYIFDRDEETAYESPLTRGN